MSIVSVDQARAHCKADAADDTLLGVYLASAVKQCAHLANRNIYETPELLATAKAGVTAAMTAANAAYEAAVLAADDIESDLDKAFAYDAAERALMQAQVDASNVLDGIVADDNIRSAILLIVGHLYRNREEVITGQGATTGQLPMGAERIMSHYRVVGPL